MPSHGASMNEQAIAAIVSNGWPGTKVESVTPLGAGKSFNNKIYFLKMQHANKMAALGEEDAVIKINGTLYDGDTQSAIPMDTFQFTHYDLFPRNILVTGSPPRITGIVDWEFPGFFPPVDEFLDDWLDGGDWPKEFYVAYLKRLEENGVATPAKSVRGDGWQKWHGGWKR
ncbi:uncharacterized protein TrAFT101_009653 [Trichoderma asperellum]|uniref:Aminoglycoside phosphotransferase domain-containing protein n=1 Tax=Trichoderma asperellum (strain ATCC 204424 / CBS 433.97 / NBRC 101777) TaxID=1042311 RepID=A0A2T3ZAA4_TRIA4|nr:hypothetical protein M441DRAFT_68750 [Trichoderma asperellum CBS 433.97]PTB41733.1 hypothetical protein M441DRAFT_68750 [Trichoderma asperellum CBS 433.97]UKZ94797.1 hypothetical protein TrAFT101_009653 [Trichoderma asperellum]